MINYQEELILMSSYLVVTVIVFLSFFLLVAPSVVRRRSSRPPKVRSSHKTTKQQPSISYLNNPNKQYSLSVPLNDPLFETRIAQVLSEIVTNPNQIPIAAEDLEINPLVGGITNIPFVVKITSLNNLKVIVRVFGERTSELIDRSIENKVFAYLSYTSIGPIFYGLFANGRVEGYFNSRSFNPDEMTDVKYSKHIAQTIGKRSDMYVMYSTYSLYANFIHHNQ